MFRSLYRAARGFVVRDDPIYDHYASTYQAKTITSRLFYLFMHLAPGVFGALVLNYVPLYTLLRDASGLGDIWYQYAGFIFVTYIWHIVLPFLVLRWSDGLSFRESLAFIGLDRFDARGVFIVLPVVLVPFTLICIPWYEYIYHPLSDWLASIEFFHMPAHSIFVSGYSEIPGLALLFLYLGNFLGEEVYYRGYLMKKCAFLGGHTWWVTSVLFVIYHFFQVELTWSQIGPALMFGAMMVWRKDLYVLIALHMIFNLGWTAMMQTSFG